MGGPENGRLVPRPAAGFIAFHHPEPRPMCEPYPASSPQLSWQSHTPPHAVSQPNSVSPACHSLIVITSVLVVKADVVHSSKLGELLADNFHNTCRNYFTYAPTKSTICELNKFTVDYVTYFSVMIQTAWESSTEFPPVVGYAYVRLIRLALAP